MNNYSNNQTYTTPPSDILKIMILQRRNDVLESIEAYYKQKFLGINSNINYARSRIYTLFKELQPALNRNYKDDKEFATDPKDIERDIREGKEEKLIQAFDKINDWLDLKLVIRLDNKKSYDSRDVENENTIKL